MLSKKSFILLFGFTISLICIIGHAESYLSEISYSLINKSKVNLTGVPAHSTTPTTTLSFPPDRPYAYSISLGVDNTQTMLCVGVGISNFSNPYVGAYALKTKDCAVTVSTKKNSKTNYTVIITNSK